MGTSFIKNKIDSLPEDLLKEVEDFIEFLMKKNNVQIKQKKNISFKWEGELEELKATYTSVELQHLISQWR